MKPCILNNTGLFSSYHTCESFRPRFLYSLFSLSIIAKTKSLDQVKAALDGQEDGMAYFYNSDGLLWVNRVGIEKGYQPILDSICKILPTARKWNIQLRAPRH